MLPFFYRVMNFHIQEWINPIQISWYNADGIVL